MAESDFHRLPKVELHEHLDGSLRPQTVLELAHENGVRIPAATVEDLVPLLSPGPSSLEVYLKAFDVTTAVMQTPEALRRVAREQVADWHQDHVVYGEIRFAPEQHVRSGMSLEAVVESVLVGLEEGRRSTGVETGLILCSMRHTEPRLDIARLVHQYRHSGVVGFDLAGAERPFPPRRHREAFEYCAENLLAVTCHAGEVTGPEYIREALTYCRSLRIGHGTQLIQDFSDNDPGKPGPLAQWIIDRGILLEVCLTSNVQTRAVSSLRDHPLPLFEAAGVRTALCTDNRLVSATTLTEEWNWAAQTWHWGVSEALRFQRRAIEAAFAPKAVKDQIASKYFERFADTKGV